MSPTSPSRVSTVGARMPVGVRLLLAPLLILGFSLFLVSVGTVVYPGAFRWTAPVLCPDGQPDPVVVRYEVQSSDGQGINFTLFCMSERGEYTEVGTWRPLGVLVGYLGAAFLLLIVLARLYRASRGHGYSDPAAPGPLSS